MRHFGYPDGTKRMEGIGADAEAPLQVKEIWQLSVKYCYGHCIHFPCQTVPMAFTGSRVDARAANLLAPQCLYVCVCVEHLKRCKTSTLIDGIAFSYQVLCHYNEAVSNILPGVYPISFSIAGGVTVDFLVTPTKLWKSTGWKFGHKLLYLQCRSWAHSSRSWGTRHI